MAEKLYASYPDRWPKERGDGACPPQLAAHGEFGLDNIIRNGIRGGPKTIDGIPWELNQQACSDGEVARVYSATAKGSRYLRFKCDANVHAASPRHVYEQLILYQNKLKWEKELCGWARQLKSYTGAGTGDPERAYPDRVDVEVYTTLPAVGGAISSRAFADARLTRFYADGAIETTMIAIDPKAPWAAPIGITQFAKAASDAGLVIARQMPGCGVRMAPTGTAGVVCVTTMSLSEIGGWLPASLCNGATAGAILKTIAGLRDVLRQTVPSGPPDDEIAREMSRRESVMFQRMMTCPDMVDGADAIPICCGVTVGRAPSLLMAQAASRQLSFSMQRSVCMQSCASREPTLAGDGSVRVVPGSLDSSYDTAMNGHSPGTHQQASPTSFAAGFNATFTTHHSIMSASPPAPSRGNSMAGGPLCRATQCRTAGPAKAPLVTPPPLTPHVIHAPDRLHPDPPAEAGCWTLCWTRICGAGPSKQE